MNADQVIDSYVSAVARRLPRRKRNDIAYELRALLGDELAARSSNEGRAPDRAMAMELLRAFGRPAEVASRYHPLPAVIDAADTHHFLLWAISGSIAISLLVLLSPSKNIDGAPYFQWLGMLVIVFSLIGLWRRTHPGSMLWKPSRDFDWMPRPLALLSLVATLIFPFFVYTAPQTFVRVMFLGAIPWSGVALTDAFSTSPLRIATIATLGALVALYAVVVVHGRFRSWTSWSFAGAHAVLGVLLIAHAAALEPRGAAAAIEVFRSEQANRTAAPIFALTGGFLLLCALYGAYRETTRIRPAPTMSHAATAPAAAA